MKFERKFYIKDLFNAHMILNQFDLIHFENYLTFNKCLMNNLFYFEKGKIIKITLNNFDEYENMIQIFSKTDLCNQMQTILQIKNQELYDQILTDVVPFHYSIEISENITPEIRKYWENGKDWISTNRIIQIISMNAENYDKKINKIISTFNESFVRFFRLDIDYESFDYLEMKELDKLKFWLHHLRNWMAEKTAKIVIDVDSRFIKPIFISEDLILYLNENKRHWIWQWFLGYNIDKNGEDIPYKELNKLRIYMDLHKEAMYHDIPIYNWRFVDFEQNLKINGSINEIPLITLLFGRWLYDSI